MNTRPQPGTADRSCLRLMGVAFVMVGILAMHVIDCFGPMGDETSPAMPSSMASASQEFVSASSAIGDSIITFSQHVADSTSSISAGSADDITMRTMGLCVALLASSIVALARLLARPPRVTLGRRMTFAGLCSPRGSDPAPPDLFRLAIQRC